jgi:hypothetical protein
MKCFLHSTVDAIAVCRGCGRAVCHECQQSTVNKEVVCSLDCESLVKRRALIELKTIDAMVGNVHACRFASVLCRFAAGLALLAAIANLCVAFLPQPFFGRLWGRDIVLECLEAAGLVVVSIGLHLLAISMERIGRRMADGLDELNAPSSHSDRKAHSHLE